MVVSGREGELCGLRGGRRSQPQVFEGLRRAYGPGWADSSLHRRLAGNRFGRRTAAHRK